MSERKFNRDQDDTEPVKFKPLYLIVGVCVVVIMVLAFVIYLYLENNEEKTPSNGNEVNTIIQEPERYVIPQTACVKEVTIGTYNDAVYSSCPVGNVVLNFTDMNMIIDINKTETNFSINGIYYNLVGIELDDYLKTGIFKGITFGQNNQDLEMIVTDFSMNNKQGLYIFRSGNVLYSVGSDSNMVFTLGETIKYSKYSSNELLDCATADPNAIAYVEGTISFDGTNYKDEFVQNVLVNAICK